MNTYILKKFTSYNYLITCVSGACYYSDSISWESAVCSAKSYSRKNPDILINDISVSDEYVIDMVNQAINNGIENTFTKQKPLVIESNERMIVFNSPNIQNISVIVEYRNEHIT